MISQSEQAVQATVDLLAGQKSSLAGQEDAPLARLPEAPKDAFLVMAADGLAELHKNKPHAAILQNAKMATVVVGEDNGEIYLDVDLTTETSDTAMQIEQVLGGIQAFIELKHAQHPEIMSLLQATTLERIDDQLFLTVQYPSTKVFEMIKAKHQLDKKNSSVEQSK